MKSVDLPGATSWHLSQTLGSAITNNFPDQSKVLVGKMLSRYPRDVYGWKMLYYMASSTPEEKQSAIAKLAQFDPFNPDNPKS